MVGIYGLVSLVFLWILILMITPVRDTQLRGWRRALTCSSTADRLCDRRKPLLTISLTAALSLVGLWLGPAIGQQ